VIVYFVDICRIVDHHCLNFLFMISQLRALADTSFVLSISVKICGQ